MPARALPPIRRLVVKIGSAVLAPSGVLEQRTVARMSADVARAHALGVQPTIVSSGAIASGFRALGLTAPPKTIVHKQAAAAVGQQRLMAAWSAAMDTHGLTVAQALYTADDLEHRGRFQSARRTLGELLSRRIVPIINENDTIAFDEIRLGDNDRLSALTADLVSADILLILSTVPGLLERGPSSRVVRTVADVRDAARHLRAGKSSVGTGGMQSKLTAAGAAASWGIPTIIASGSEPEVISRVLGGEPIGTFFEPAARKARPRKRWLAFSARAEGTIVADAGAVRAVTQRGASLLPGGITVVRGAFDRGATVEVCGPDGAVVARGVTLYASADIARIAGKRSAQIAGILGDAYADEVIHRDDLVLV